MAQQRPFSYNRGLRSRNNRYFTDARQRIIERQNEARWRMELMDNDRINGHFMWRSPNRNSGFRGRWRSAFQRNYRGRYPFYRQPSSDEINYLRQFNRTVMNDPPRNNSSMRQDASTSTNTSINSTRLDSTIINPKRVVTVQLKIVAPNDHFRGSSTPLRSETNSAVGNEDACLPLAPPTLPGPPPPEASVPPQVATPVVNQVPEYTNVRNTVARQIIGPAVRRGETELAGGSVQPRRTTNTAPPHYLHGDVPNCCMLTPWNAMPMRNSVEPEHYERFLMDIFHRGQ